MGEVTGLLTTPVAILNVFCCHCVHHGMCADKLAGLQVYQRLHGHNVTCQVLPESSDEEQQWQRVLPVQFCLCGSYLMRSGCTQSRLQL